jgi:hypothetical protein
MLRPMATVLALVLAGCGAVPTTESATPTASAAATPTPTPRPTRQPTPTPEPAHSLLVTLDVHDPNATLDEQIGLICETSAGYDDIHEGTQITVRDETESVIGLGELGAGFWRPDDEICWFVARVEDLPEARFYSVEIRDRGVLRYSRAEMEEADWSVSLQLGGD